jgi:hypothetical protein
MNNLPITALLYFRKILYYIGLRSHLKVQPLVRCVSTFFAMRKLTLRASIGIQSYKWAPTDTLDLSNSHSKSFAGYYNSIMTLLNINV